MCKIKVRAWSLTGLLAVTVLCSSWAAATASSWGTVFIQLLTSCWMSLSFSHPKVINHQGSAAEKHQRIYDCSRQIFSSMFIMQQLDWQCAIKLESVAVLLVNSMVGYLCGASDCSRKKESVLIKSLQNFFNLGNHQECFIWMPKTKRKGISEYKWTYV